MERENWKPIPVNMIRLIKFNDISYIYTLYIHIYVIYTYTSVTYSGVSVRVFFFLFYLEVEVPLYRFIHNYGQHL